MTNKKNSAISLSIIIVNFNAGEVLIKCIDSIVNSLGHSEIIIIDNASTDGSLHQLKQVNFGVSPLVIHKNTTNLGFSTACNIGIHLAKGPVLLFLNPDCILERNTIIRLKTILERKPTTGMCGALLLNPDGTEQAGGRRRVPTPWRTFVRIFKLKFLSRCSPRLFNDFNLHKQPLPKKPIEVEAISGACMMVKKEAIENVGLWDEGYFLHCEDLDWCMRFRQNGWKIKFVPEAKVIHFQGACCRNRPVFVEWHKHKGMMRFYRKFFQHQYPGILMGAVAFAVWLRFTLIATTVTFKRVSKCIGF